MFYNSIFFMKVTLCLLWVFTILSFLITTPLKSIIPYIRINLVMDGVMLLINKFIFNINVTFSLTGKSLSANLF